jgi:hypothetical protein
MLRGAQCRLPRPDNDCPSNPNRRAAEGVLVAPEAGEMLYRLRGSNSQG